MRIHKYQRGMTSTGWLIVAALVGFFLTLFFKMGPVYLSNMSVRSALASMAGNNTDFHSMDKSEIYLQIGNYFSINGVNNHNPKDLDIVRKNDYTLINHVYEERVHLFLNVDVVMSFKNQVNSSDIDSCCKYLVEDDK